MAPFLRLPPDGRREGGGEFVPNWGQLNEAQARELASRYGCASFSGMRPIGRNRREYGRTGTLTDKAAGVINNLDPWVPFRKENGSRASLDRTINRPISPRP
jgi:hypothetical protein